MNGGGAGSTGAGKGTVDNTKSAIGRERDRLVGQLKKSFPDKFKATIKEKDGKTRTITIEVKEKDYKHIVNDSLNRKIVPTSKLNKLSKQIKNTYCRKSSDLYKNRTDKIDKFYYLKVRGRKLYFNIARYKHKSKNEVYYTYRLHAITKRCR